MSTEKQVKANRKNAQKSTGPKTDEGKATVSQNAVKHGIFTESVIKGEKEADYEAFHDKMVSEMKPVGPAEILLAERIVSLWWRLERAERIQNQAIDVMIERDEPSPLEKSLQKWMPKDIGPDTRGAGPELVLGRSIIKDYSNSRVLDRMMLYERRIENSMIKTMRELERRQLIRQYQQQEADEELTRQESVQSAEKKGDLKKQSQFMPGMTCAKSYLKEAYDNNSPAGDEQNKAKQSQSQTNRRLAEPVRGEISKGHRACQ
jgi:hypothetical protein